MKALYITLFALPLLFADPASSQSFAHINTNELMMQMPEFKMAQLELEKFSMKLQKELQEMEVVFKQKHMEFEQNEENASEPEKEGMIKELEEIRMRVEKFQREAEQQLELKHIALKEPIVTKATKAINKVAKANGYDYVMDSGAGTLIVVPDSRDLMKLTKKELGI